MICGLIVWVVYTRQKKDSIMTIAGSILVEVEYIEEKISDIQDIAGYHPNVDVIYKRWEDFIYLHPIVISNEWNKKRMYIFNRINNNNFKLLSEFYASALAIENARSHLHEYVMESRKYKAEAVQHELVRLASENIEAPSASITFQATKLINKFDLGLGEFKSTTYATYMCKCLERYQRVSNTPAYEELKKISDGKFTVLY